MTGAALSLHDDPILFREALNYTAAETGFLSRLIEKDYYCSLLLQYLAESESGIVFKGGTCLAKVHADFYRLSEDLDFSIPTPLESSRGYRREAVARSKEAVARTSDRLPGLEVVSPLTGANASTQYIATIGYASSMEGQPETIKVEIGLREPLLTPAVRGAARTLLRNPVTGSSFAPLFTVPCLSRPETMAEKLRAALSRRDVAIRDYYDIDYAVRKLGIDILEPEFIELVAAKLRVAGNDPVDVSPARLAALSHQSDTQLRAVLRAHDFAAFDLERAFASVAAVAAATDFAQANNGPDYKSQPT